MNCAEFKNWLLGKNDHDQSADQEAKLHRLSCSRCEKLYKLDRIMEERLAESFVEVDPPADLFEKIKRDGRYAEIREPGPDLNLKLLAATLATAVIFMVVFFNPFKGQIRSIDEIKSLVLANHLNSDTILAFKAGQISDVSAWFAERIGYPVHVPDMAGEGFTLLGGRKCSLGHKKAAYLVYEKEGKKCSLFIINPNDLAFGLERDRKYSSEENDNSIKVWSDKGLVYAMVM
jgi:hypothetical protein